MFRVGWSCAGTTIAVAFRRPRQKALALMRILTMLLERLDQTGNTQPEPNQSAASGFVHAGDLPKTET